MVYEQTTFQQNFNLLQEVVVLCLWRWVLIVLLVFVNSKLYAGEVDQMRFVIEFVLAILLMML